MLMGPRFLIGDWNSGIEVQTHGVTVSEPPAYGLARQDGKKGQLELFLWQHQADQPRALTIVTKMGAWHLTTNTPIGVFRIEEDGEVLAIGTGCAIELAELQLTLRANGLLKLSDCDWVAIPHGAGNDVTKIYLPNKSPSAAAA